MKQNKYILRVRIINRVQQAMEKGINPDALLDIIRLREYWSQEDFDDVVNTTLEIKMVGDKLYDIHYVCGCGKIKNVPDRYFCQICNDEWMKALGKQ
jgi:hypothetical protein